MIRVTAVAVVVALFASIGWAEPPKVPAKKPLTPDALKAEIEALKPAQFAWREIQWKTCLLEGLKEAREKKKPILLWVVGPGEALDGRC
jgi:hypothetical protein